MGWWHRCDGGRMAHVRRGHRRRAAPPPPPRWRRGGGGRGGGGTAGRGAGGRPPGGGPGGAPAPRGAARWAPPLEAIHTPANETPVMHHPRGPVAPENMTLYAA